MTDERTTEYLLEELTEREAEQFEEQLFAQPEWPGADLDAAEEDLIDAYIRNELTPERQQRFEEKYLTTEARRERVLLARSFLRVVCLTDSRKVTWMERVRSFWSAPAPAAPRFATAGLATAVVIVGVALVLVWLAFRPGAPQTFAQLNLTISSASRSESAQAPKVTLPLGHDALRISLELPEPAPKDVAYRVHWENVNGPLESLTIESQDERSVSVVIPAASLSRGRYALKLNRIDPGGTESRVDGSYLFTVE